MDISRILGDVPDSEAFWLNNGVVIRNIYELASEIEQLNEFYFRYHSNEKHDDFAAWIGGVLGDAYLAELLHGVRDKEEYVRIIRHRIKYLDRIHSLNVARHMLSDSISSFTRKHDVLLKISVVALFVAVLFLGYTQYTALQALNSVSSRLSYTEQASACYSSYFNSRITSIEESNSSLPQLTCDQNYTYIIRGDSLESRPGRIPLSDVYITSGQVIINVTNVTWVIFGNTSSMLPGINHNTQAIEVMPRDMGDIHVGDIVAYTSGREVIIHRVIEEGTDSDGSYIITKGDNNNIADPLKVRFNQVVGVVVALIY